MPIAGTSSVSAVRRGRSKTPRHSGPYCNLCVGKTGLFMSSRPWLGLGLCFAIWAAIPIAWPSAITGSFLLMGNRSHSVGKTMRGNKQRLMTLSASEFLRRYVQHVLPHGFVRIRQFGFLANRHRSTSIAVIRRLLASDAPSRESPPVTSCEARWQCPRCGHPMQISCRLTAREVYLLCERLDTS